MQVFGVSLSDFCFYSFKYRLRMEQLRDVLMLDDQFTSVLKIKDPATGINNCDPLCDLNAPFHLISVCYVYQKWLAFAVALH